MGYHTTPALIEDNINLLTQIKQAIDAGTPLKYDIPKGGNISYEQYKLRRVLAAADNHPEVMSGVFHGLGQRTTIRVEFEQHRLSIEPKKGSKGSQTLKLEMVQKNEDDVAKELTEYGGSMLTITFKPSTIYIEAAFKLSLANMGWILHKNTLVKNEDGTRSYVCERLDDPAGFDMLDRTQEG